MTDAAVGYGHSPWGSGSYSMLTGTADSGPVPPRGPIARARNEFQPGLSGHRTAFSSATRAHVRPT